MKKFIKSILTTPILGRSILMVFRLKTAIRYFRKPLFDLFKWLFNSKETTNFTYDLDELNKYYLASVISDVLNIEFNIIYDYIKEIENDEELKSHIESITEKSDIEFMSDKKVRYGRRIGWYAIARAIKPKIIVETGVDKGLGSCLLTAALKRNKEEGYEGRYYGTDINPQAGYLLTDVYAQFGQILCGDSIDSLRKCEEKIDLFINDSDHSAHYEAEEYKTIANKLSEQAVILGDNSHCTDKLFKFSLETGRHFIFFQEKPIDHWYPGAGIGISFNR